LCNSTVNKPKQDDISELERLIAEYLDVKRDIVDLLAKNADVSHLEIQQLDTGLSETCDKILNLPLNSSEDRLQRMRFVSEEIHEICENSTLALQYTESLMNDAALLAK